MQTYIESIHADEWLCKSWRDADLSRSRWEDLSSSLHGGAMCLPSFCEERDEIKFLSDLLWEKYELELLGWQQPECDACGKRAPVARCEVTGIETYACEECRG